MSEQNKIDAERAAFEFAANQKFYGGLAAVGDTWSEDRGMYVDPAHHMAWWAWQHRTSLPVGVPDGYALVPVEPTPEIRQAIDLLCDDHRAFDDSEAFWQYLLDSSPAAPTVKAERVQREECGGNGAGGDHEDDCSKAPSLPAAGSAVEEVDVVAYQSIDATHGGGYMVHKHQLPQSHIDDGALQEPLMTVAQHERIVAAMQQDLDYFPPTVRALTETIAELRAALSAQQSAPERVSVPVELLQDLHDLASDAVEHHRAAFAGYKLERQANMDATVDKARALLASHGRGEA